MDAETFEATLAQARAIEARDPDAAQFLYRQLAHVTKARRDITPTIGYSPMEAYAQAAYYFKWSDTDIGRVDFRRFRGYMRELGKILQKENERNSGQAQSNPAQEAQVMHSFVRPHVYEGSVVRVEH